LTIEGTNGKTVTFTENDQLWGNLEFASTGATDSLTLAFTEGQSGQVSNLILTDIETVSITTASENDDLNLSFIDTDGVDSISFAGAGDILTGGLGGSSAVQLIDLSGQTGAFNMGGGVFDFIGPDTTDFVIGNLGGSSYIELGADGGVNQFTFGAALDNTLQINDFEGGVGGDVLSLGGLGVSSFTDLSFGEVGGNTTITSAAFGGEITLVGVTIAELDGAANFSFAVA
jgi:hypothetical protein